MSWSRTPLQLQEREMNDSYKLQTFHFMGSLRYWSDNVLFTFYIPLHTFTVDEQVWRRRKKTSAARRERRNVVCIYMRACLSLVFVLLFCFSGTTDYESIQTNKKRQKKPSPTKYILFRLMNIIINDNSMKQSIEWNIPEKIQYFGE